MNNPTNEVIADLSRTQRITLKRKSGSVTLQKEWRKQDENTWMVGKGIEIPDSSVPRLIESLGNTQRA
jgi:hypothetical protein